MIMLNIVDSEIKSKYDASELINIHDALPLLKLDRIQVAVDDQGPMLALSIEFENPFKLELNATGLDAGIAINDTPVARISLSQIQLKQGLQVFSSEAKIRFNDPTIDISKFSQLLSDTLSLVLDDKADQLRVALVGPIRIKSTTFAQEITSPLALNLPVKEIVHKFHLNNVKSLLTVENIKKLMKDSTMSLDLTSDSITIPFTAVLPRLLPLPPVVEIPFYGQVGLYDDSQHTLSMGSSPIRIETTDSAIHIATSMVVYPNNTDTASVALANIVNPLLSVPAKVSNGIGLISRRLHSF
jgi:hypothetical protein